MTDENPDMGQSAMSVEERLARIERALFGDEHTCSCGAPRINEHWCSGGHYRESWNQIPPAVKDAPNA